MSSDRPKPRKVASQPAWRVKRTESVPVKKYSRSELLGLYRLSEVPVYLVPEEMVAEVALVQGIGPMFAAEQSFEHQLGEDVSARERPAAKMPDWYSESSEKKPGILPEDRAKVETVPDLQKRTSSEPKTPEAVSKPQDTHKTAEVPPKPIKVVIDKNAVIRNLPKDLETFSLQLEVKTTPQTSIQHGEDFFTEEFSQIDREMEKRLKKDEDQEEEMPEWANAPLPTQSATRPPALQSTLPQPSIQTNVPRFIPSQHSRGQSTPTATTQSPTMQSSLTPSQSPTVPSSLTPSQSPTVPSSSTPSQSPTLSQKQSAFPQVSAPLFDTRPPKFHISLLQDQIKAGNPFAKVIFQNGVPDIEGFMCCIPLSLPLERAWFYKDPKSVVQGPFSSIEMYNWNLIGYFAPNLQVSWRTPNTFHPLCELQRAPNTFWGSDQDMVATFAPTLPTLPAEPSKPVKQTLEINPNQAIRSMLGMDTHRKTSSGWVAKTDKDANRRR